MLVEFILAELVIWAGMIAAVPVAAAMGIFLMKTQAQRRADEWAGVRHGSSAKASSAPTVSTSLKAAATVPARRPA